MTTEMDAPTAYMFVMDRWTPDTIPMRRLAQYLDKLSGLLGCQDSVHFKKITKGSARPAWNVDAVAAAEVASNLQAADSGASADGVRLCRDINRMLMDDGQAAYLRVMNGPKVMQFAGRNTPIAQEVVVHEAGELEGVVIRVGGRDASVPVQLLGADDHYRCNTTRAIAKQLAPLLFDKQVRVSGKGKWRRNVDSVWILEEFQITDFVALDNSSTADFLNEMRAIPGSGWNDMPDPQVELKRFRGD